MELAEAERWLEGLINVERMPDMGRARLTLAPIQALLARVGDPQRGLRALHVAGSKGKGSTALIAEAVLGAAGVRTGVFTSPHLVRWTERFRIDGREVAGERLADALTRLRPAADALREGDDPPSFFDVTTAAAFLLFAEAGVEVAVLEVGLGGRLDSTNVCEPAVTCVTSIELEHTEKLGTTHAAIAAEKAGIAKPGVPLVMGALPAAAAEVVAARAREVGAPLFAMGEAFQLEAVAPGAEGGRALFRDGELALELSLGTPGAHQLGNAALALACVRRLGLVDDDALARAAGAALPGLALPGRIEILGRDPWLVVDGAHTAASARALAEALARLDYAQGHLVLSVSAGKDVRALCEALAPRFARATVTRAEPHRSLDPSELAAVLAAAAPGLEVACEPDPERAARQARASASSGSLVCATGSVYMAGAARAVWGTA